MACKELLRGHDISCELPFRKYYQQLVLINLDDVNQVSYDVSNVSHSIVFNLTDGAKGYRYMGNEIASLYSASFSKTTKKGQPFYNHSVNLPIIGVSIETKLVLKELDLANYFAAIQFRDGTVEIYGFENGLKTDDYTYEVQNGLGGTGITLSSRYDEEDVPYVYLGGVENYDNDFMGIGELFGGDFNNDFNNDFFIFEL